MLSKLQATILTLLASHRDLESYVAGSTPLIRHEARLSGDIDIFHDREARVATAADLDMAALLAAGLQARWTRRLPLFHQAVVTSGSDSTRLDWVVDSDFRFYPAIRDSSFGYVLHPVDLATNKIMAAAGRREPRDIVDLVTIHRRILPLGAVAMAAVGRSPGFTPEGLINEVRRLARYQQEDFDVVASDPPVDAGATLRGLRAALDDADSFVRKVPTDFIGVLFLENGEPVQPDPDHLSRYQTRAGSRQGIWPSSPDIEAAMMQTYARPDPDA